MVHCTVFPIFLEQRLLIDDLKTSDHFEGRESTGSGLFALLSDDFEQIFGQIVSTTEKTLSNTNLEASRHIKREKGSVPVYVRRSKTSLLISYPSSGVLQKNLYLGTL